MIPRVDGANPQGRDMADVSVVAQEVQVARMETPTPVLPAKTGAEAQNDPHKLSPEQVERAVARMNLAAQMVRTHLKFELHEGPHRIVVKVIRDDTGEVVRQIPPGDVIEMDEQMRSMLGMFFDQKI